MTVRSNLWGVLLLVLASATPAVALAHPGHGETDPDGLLHYATEPVHAIPVAALVVLGGVVLVRRRSRSRPPS